MLMYLVVCTRPDLAFVVTYFSRYQESPTDRHWTGLKRLLRYLRGTSNFRLTFERHEGVPVLEGFADANWASDPVTRKSTTGYLFKLSGNTIIWASRKQNKVTLSTTESEYVAACHAATEALWIKKVLVDLNISIDGAITINEDNQGAIFISKNGEIRRSKHIEVKLYFLRDLVQQGIIKLSYIRSDAQEADLLTKPLTKNRFHLLVGLLGIDRGRVLTASDNRWQ